MAPQHTTPRVRRVVVVGSVNLDLASFVDHLPRPGETVVAERQVSGFGGKGANQAAAAACAGAPVAMVGAVGRDDGGPVVESLAAAGVDVSGVVAVDAPTGRALVTVDVRSGENMIVVHAGANECLDVALQGLALRQGDLLVTQLEARPDLVPGLLAMARSAGAVSLLNAAPAGVGGSVPALPDHLVVNEVELRALAGGGPGTALDLARGWAARHAGTLVVTLGAGGALAVTGAGDAVEAVPAPITAAVDTTGAGDCFVGWLAARLAAGASLSAGVAEAVVAASLSCTRPGAAASFPSRDEVGTGGPDLQSGA